MSEKIEFGKNYSDLSTNKGFQFEFFCDRCHGSHRTEFHASITGNVSSFLNIANTFVGGLFGKAADVSEKVRSAGWEKEHDEAFLKAVKEIQPEFIQCPRCMSWVCRKGCWNLKKGLCKQCAPDLGVEMAAAQASRSVEEVWAHAKMADEDKILSEDNWKDAIKATCPKCEKPLPSKVKFCPECGEKINISLTCNKCGSKITPETKFCPECGNKVN